MTEEETDALYNEILKLPKVERPITATTQCEINVNDLFDTIRAFRKIPDYNELIKDNHKKQQEIERLNNIINELKWKPINEYENPKYDWVLVKMFFKCDNFECIPRVAEKRFNHWYDANGYEIDEDMFEIKYFMDMQQIDKLYGLKGEYKKEVIKSERRIKDCF